MKIKLITFGFILCSQLNFAQTKLNGLWKGDIKVNKDTFAIEVTFDKENGEYTGKMNVPIQNAQDLPLKNIRTKKDSVYFTFGNSIMIFDGKASNDSIHGVFKQAIYTGSFSLKFIGTPKDIAEKLPYNEQEVSFPNGDITLGGTLSTPKGKGPFPAVILITGSGAQNRNETIYGFEIFKVIADHLTKKGIAVLRLDDRGIGKSTGDFAKSTTLDFAGDIEKAYLFLKEQKQIDSKQIGLFGHSEGGIIAPIVANKYPEIAFIVSMAGPTLKGDDLLLLQTKALLKSSGANDSLIKATCNSNKIIYEAVLTGRGWDKVDSMLYIQFKQELDSMDVSKKAFVRDPDKFIRMRIQTQEKQLQSPWFKYFLSYDPAAELDKLNCRALLLYGSKDLQVPAKENISRANEITKGKTNFSIKTIDDANHLFQKAKTGSPEEYSKLDKLFVAGFMENITSFILQK